MSAPRADGSFLKTWIVSAYVWLVGFPLFAGIISLALLWTYCFNRERYDPWLKALLRLFFRVIFVRIEVSGRENVRTDRPYLFMANHVSAFDLPLLTAIIPVSFHGVAASHQFRWPVYGWFVRRYGTIPIDRDNSRSALRSLRQAEELLRAGKSVVILPEGYRSIDGKLGEFKRMPFHLARRAGADIIPIGMSGLFRLKPKGSWRITPTTLQFRFGAPISARAARDMSCDELRLRVRQAIEELLRERN